MKYLARFLAMFDGWAAAHAAYNDHLAANRGARF